MRYPEHTLFVRRIALSTTPTGKPCAVFRANPLNPRANWGLPVPFLMSTYVENPLDTDGSATGYEELPDPVLYFDKYAAPLHAYLPLLQATAHYPIDHNYMKIGYDPDPNDRPSLLREISDVGLHAALFSGRNRCIVKMFLRLVEKEEYIAADAVKLVGTRFEVGERVVRRALADGGYEILDRDGLSGTTLGPRREHRLSRAYEYHYMHKELEVAARTIRANTPGCSFSLEDLAVDTAPGGYPTHCPVTGLELEYGVTSGASMHSPKVCRVDPTLPAVSSNMMVASKLGRGIVEGTMAVDTIVAFMRNKDDARQAMRNWTREHRVARPIKVREAMFKLEP